MISIEMNEHWRFAYISAIIRLEFFAWEFDFAKEIDGKNYIDFPKPTRLMAIIDGLLTDISDLQQGDIDRLARIKERFANEIVKTYETGVEQAHKLWFEASENEISEYINYDNNQIQAKAKSELDSSWSIAEQSWFIESFCKTWQLEIIEAYRHKLNSK